MVAILAIVGAYFFGGIPVGLLVGRAKGIDDIRKHGSGNIGASNVLRLIGVKAGLFVWIVDALKGYLPIAIGISTLGMQGWWLIGLAVAAMGGHCFSPYLRLTGGRGVSTSLGVLIGLDWRAGVLCFAVWILVVSLTRYISLASMIGCAVAAPVLALLGREAPLIAAGGAIALIVVIRHAPNIQRLIAGTERKIGQKERTEPAGDQVS